MTLIRLTNVTKAYPAPCRRGPGRSSPSTTSRSRSTPATIYGIIGYSGAGKSTVLRLVNALEAPTSGAVEINGRDITKLREKDLRECAVDIGMIFQQFNLFESRTVAGNIAYPLGSPVAPKAEIKSRVAELLDFVGLGDKAKSYPEQLSGGQKQRVGIARALATEPAASCSPTRPPAHSIPIRHRRCSRCSSASIASSASRSSSSRTKWTSSGRSPTKVAVMENGRIIESGDVFDVLSAPRNAATQRFVASIIKDVPVGERAADAARPARRPDRDDLDPRRQHHARPTSSQRWRPRACGSNSSTAVSTTFPDGFSVTSRWRCDGPADAGRRAIDRASAFTELIEEVTSMDRLLDLLPELWSRDIRDALHRLARARVRWYRRTPARTRALRDARRQSATPIVWCSACSTSWSTSSGRSRS